MYLGSLRKAKKQKKRGQKEVDVMLAVQMMEHAFRGNMNKAVLLSGDLDFRPLVESLVRLGLFIEVAGDQHHVSQDLIHASDSHRKLNFKDYYQWVVEEQKKLRIFRNDSVVFKLDIHSSIYKLVKEGVWNNEKVFVFSVAPKTYCLTSTLFDGVAWTGNNCDELELIFELIYGKAEWE